LCEVIDLNVLDGGVWNVDEVLVACDAALKNDKFLSSLKSSGESKSRIEGFRIGIN
jgi:hypothetical protein